MSILLDPEIRDWVFLPLLLALFLLARVKFSLSSYLSPAKPPASAASSDSALKNSQNQIKLSRSKKFSANYSLLPFSSFVNRKSHFCHPENGLLIYNDPGAQENPMEAMASNPMMNPEGMTSMLKGSFMMIATMGLQYWGISYFFSGMLVGRVGFPVPQKFREMLQKGIEIVNIDVKYISALSLYFLTFMGVDGVLNLFLGGQGGKKKPAMDMGPMAAPPMPGMGGMGGMPGGDKKKDFENAMNELKVIKHEFAMDKAPVEFLGNYSKE